MNVNNGPDVLEQIPATGPVNQPESGTYGAKAETDRLHKSLATAGGSGSPPAARQPRPVPTGGPEGRAPSGPASPGQVPDLLLRPTQRPDVPAATPLRDVTAPQPANAKQQRLLTLQMMAENPSLSEETREWAAMVVKKLASRG